MRGHSSTELNSRLSRRALRRRTVFRPTPRARFCRRASAFRASRSESRAVTRTEVSVCTTRHRPSGRQRKPLGVPFSLLTDIVLPPAVALSARRRGLIVSRQAKPAGPGSRPELARPGGLAPPGSHCRSRIPGRPNTGVPPRGISRGKCLQARHLLVSKRRATAAASETHGTAGLIFLSVKATCPYRKAGTSAFHRASLHCLRWQDPWSGCHC